METDRRTFLFPPWTNGQPKTGQAPDYSGDRASFHTADYSGEVRDRQNRSRRWPEPAARVVLGS